ncbi:MAG: carbonic anhydrase [Stigonema ocellatum SAG 48.90 = DSM 106950]|nr:carbonic anhydrase [Stigonema ocellatum SAG 48.90 = DSM 106950]
MSRINGFVGRRNFLKLAGVGGVGIGSSAVGELLWQEQAAVAQQPSNTDTVAKPKPINSEAALDRLIEGNKRFVEDKRLNPHQSKIRLEQTAVAQYPFAAILGCADSRVPAEIIFDQGLGDLFVVRLAGNVTSPTAIGSLEFATSVLGAQLIVVLGHTKCGAVIAATKNDLLPGRIGTFVEDIKPAVERVKNKEGDLVDNAVTANVQYQQQLLAESSTIFRKLIKEGKLKITGGRYDLASGKVSWLT